jgi:hypothetical protein
MLVKRGSSTLIGFGDTEMADGWATRTNQIFGLLDRVAAARKKLGKQPGQMVGFTIDCPACKGKQSVTIISDGKRMLRLYCATDNCLRALG